MRRMWCMRVHGLNSWVGYFNVKMCDVWEGNVTTRREIWTENIHSLGFSDMVLKKIILQKLGNSGSLRLHWIEFSTNENTHTYILCSNRNACIFASDNSGKDPAQWGEASSAGPQTWNSEFSVIPQNKGMHSCSETRRLYICMHNIPPSIPSPADSWPGL